MVLLHPPLMKYAFSCGYLVTPDIMFSAQFRKESGINIKGML